MKLVPLKLSVCVLFLAICLNPNICWPAQKAAMAIDDGYTGKVLQKIIDTGKIQVNKANDVKLYLDENGRLTDCRKIRGDETEAICQAAKAASPFGQPPYGINTIMVVSFWGDDRTFSKKNDSDKKSQSTNHDDNNMYVNKITKELRNSIYIPQETKKGTYHATVSLNIGKDGVIEKSNIVKSSGDSRLDKYVLQGIKRAGKVAAPPANLKNPLDVTFTLTRL